MGRGGSFQGGSRGRKSNNGFSVIRTIRTETVRPYYSKESRGHPPMRIPRVNPERERQKTEEMPAKMYCVICGHQNIRGSDLCADCLEPLWQDYNCRKCLLTIQNASWKFCKRCGTPVPELEKEMDTVDSSSKGFTFKIPHTPS